MGTKNVIAPEQVGMFLSILSHYKKNCVVKHDFMRSGRTVSKHFHAVLHGVCKLHTVLLAKPIPITEDCLDPQWKWFKGCFGALDGTFIDVQVPLHEKGHCRTKKGQIAVNVLGVCNPNMQFIYVLSGWEGSVANNRVLRDAIHRDDGLCVPSGNYYLCDNGYTNAKGFLTSYRGVRYHLCEWDRGTGGPRNKEELFNLKHSFTRNVIERNEMPDDPLEREIPDAPVSVVETDVECISTIESNPVWSAWRDDLASSMYAECLYCSLDSSEVNYCCTMLS
ncbi:UNVERIFIED_CONTAM: hypothetical protein Scaly_3044600 [Sesamum calycinum]|uniref:Transposase n=1 Tax=Sesamum calycinum TaxID=2727403 RepID=A0AAW2K2L4_9LAMI